MKQFYNAELNAPNVLKVNVDASVVQELLPICGGTLDRGRFSSISPPWQSDMCWISANSARSFAEFQSLFDRLGVAAHVEPYVDFDTGVRLYCGFLVTRSVCEAPDFHVDWEDTNNEAFTLLTPVTGNCEGFGLLYRQINGEIAEYEYRLGEGLIIGDHFVHSTKPGRSDEPVVLLSFTFGSDKMIHWPKIARTADANQAQLIRRPDGTFRKGSGHRRMGAWAQARTAAGRAMRIFGLR
jgi:hypothetical protein